MKSRKYLIDFLLKAGKVHLLGGPSGSGKSTWLLETLALEWSKSKPVLGYKSNPVPWVYISADRSTDSVLETMERIGIPEEDVRIYSMTDNNALLDINSVILKCMLLTPKPELVVIEGMASLMKGSHNNYQHVAKFLQVLGLACADQDITIIGVVHSTKCKQGEEFLNPRQRVLGSVAWAAYSETVLLIEPVGLEQNGTSPQRRLYVLPRQSKEFTVEMLVDEKGRLRPAPSPEDDLTDALSYAYLQTVKPDGEFSTADFIDHVGVPERSAKRLLSKLLETGQIQKSSWGKYRKCQVV